MVKRGLLWGKHQGLWSLHGVTFTYLLPCPCSEISWLVMAISKIHQGAECGRDAQRSLHCCWWLLRALLHNLAEQQTWEITLPILTLSLMAIANNLFLFPCCLILKPFIVVTFYLDLFGSCCGDLVEFFSLFIFIIFSSYWKPLCCKSREMLVLRSLSKYPAFHIGVPTPSEVNGSPGNPESWHFPWVLELEKCSSGDWSFIHPCLH